jgi:hypothetical protein
MAEYTAMKKANPRPLETTMVTDCYDKTRQAVQQATPCSKIQAAYEQCLTKHALHHKKNLKCMQYVVPLEECTAKHVGKLD